MIDNKKVRIKPDRNKKVYKPKKHRDRPSEVTKER